MTICTYNRQSWFGRIEHDIMILNELGQIVVEKWLKISRIYPGIRLDEFILMPNHLHGIIVINHQVGDLFWGINNFLRYKVETPHQSDVGMADSGYGQNRPRLREDFKRGVSALGKEETPHLGNAMGNDCQCNQNLSSGANASRGGVSTIIETHVDNPHHQAEWKAGSLGVIINQFKSTSTKQIRRINSKFYWQERFYDRIIRNEEGLFNARQYIVANPSRWERDRNNPAGLGM